MARKGKEKQAEFFARCAEDVNAGAVAVSPLSDMRRPDEHRKHHHAHCLVPAALAPAVCLGSEISLAVAAPTTNRSQDHSPAAPSPLKL